ncbi:hypothetical protein GYA25_02325 [Candidatus Woesearchaeota archaeon]|nr:hypothetical protein [Candidatus Woesearchaeota archaeon]
MEKILNETNEREIPFEEREAYIKDPSLSQELSFYEKVYYETIREEVIRCNRYFSKKLPLENPNKYHLGLVDELYSSLDPELLFSD